MWNIPLASLCYLSWPCFLAAFCAAPHWHWMKYCKVLDLGWGLCSNSQIIRVLTTLFSSWIQNTQCCVLATMKKIISAPVKTRTVWFWQISRTKIEWKKFTQELWKPPEVSHLLCSEHMGKKYFWYVLVCLVCGVFANGKEHLLENYK